MPVCRQLNSGLGSLWLSWRLDLPWGLSTQNIQKTLVKRFSILALLAPPVISTPPAQRRVNSSLAPTDIFPFPEVAPHRQNASNS